MPKSAGECSTSSGNRDRRNEYQRHYRRRVGNTATHKYEKTKSGFLMRVYRNMQSRVQGVQWKKAHLYEGLSILPRADFYAWANSSSDFHRLWEDWVAAGRGRRLTPSVDRVDTDKGYSLDNMRWLTHSENSRQGAFNRYYKQSYIPTIVRIVL